jgi:hypothetical protein
MRSEPSVSLPDVGTRLAVLSDGSSVSVIGANGAARIRFEADGSSGRLISTGQGGDVVVAEGPTGQIIDMFAKLRAEAAPRRRGGSVRWLVSGVAAAALVLLPASIMLFRPLQGPTFDPAVLQRVINLSQGARGPEAAAVLGGASATTAGAALKSVPLPEKLPSLDEAAAPKPAPSAKASAAPASVVAAARAPQAAGTEPASAQASAAAGSPIAEPAAQAPATVGGETPAPAKAEANASDGRSADAKPQAGETPASGPESVTAAIARMNPIEAQKAVKTLDEIKTSLADNGEISPELLRQIPHEIAKALREAGVDLTPGERREAGRKSSSVVRLPSSAIEAFRGRDGIASITDSNSWVLTNGIVMLPLPGGGDIRTADTMLEFGLKP